MGLVIAQHAARGVTALVDGGVPVFYSRIVTPVGPHAQREDLTVDSISFDALAEDLLGRARHAHSGRAARTVFGGAGHVLRQTVIVLLDGQDLAEHNSPGEATLQVLHGRVRLSAPSGAIEASAGDFVAIPPERHALAALEDAVVLLTVVAT